jgi:hypothetical protein
VGQFKTLDGAYCYPLTVQDAHSRFLLDCKGMAGLDMDAVIRRFDRLFSHLGLPEAIRTDNGHPFASSTGLGRLSRLSVFFVKLGIRPEFIQPGKPQQNGHHERMHRTLKARTTRPPAQSLRAQQRRFDSFSRIYNEERPHEALGQATPASIYTLPERPRPDDFIELSDPAHFELRQVSQDATLRWRCRKVAVSHILKREIVGLEETCDGVWSVYFGPVQLGWLNEKDGRIMDTLGADRTRQTVNDQPRTICKGSGNWFSFAVYN